MISHQFKCTLFCVHFIEILFKQLGSHIKIGPLHGIIFLRQHIDVLYFLKLVQVSLVKDVISLGKVHLIYILHLTSN